jgi:hypothetical protein
VVVTIRHRERELPRRNRGEIHRGPAELRHFTASKALCFRVMLSLAQFKAQLRHGAFVTLLGSTVTVSGSAWPST